MANARLQLTQDIYMKLDGQWQIVLSGSVIDTPSPTAFTPAHVAVLAETPNAVAAHTSVRSVRTR